MRHSNVVSRTGGWRLLGVPPKRLLLLAAFLFLCGWALWSLLQEAYLEHQLSSEASALARQNAALAAENQGYRRDTLALQSGAAAEEDARLNGYARGDEKVYLVAPPPSPKPAPSPRSAAAHAAAAAAGGGSFWDWLRALLHI